MWSHRMIWIYIFYMCLIKPFHEIWTISCLACLVKIISRRQDQLFFFFFLSENRLWYCMQMVFLRDHLHKISKPVVWKNKTILSICLSAELAQRVVKVKGTDTLSGGGGGGVGWGGGNYQNCFFVPFWRKGSGLYSISKFLPLKLNANCLPWRRMDMQLCQNFFCFLSGKGSILKKTKKKNKKKKKNLAELYFHK